MTMTKTGTAPTRTSDNQAVRDVLGGIVAAWAANDADAFAGFYADDATVVLPGGVFHVGRNEIRAYMAAGFAGPMKGSRSVDEQENVRFIGDNAAIVVSRSGFQLPGENRVPADRLRRATWVLSKRDDRWLVEAYHNCPA
jgi:uncharacterized protein (TIGR02246 family)